MFREMRRKKKEISVDEAKKLLHETRRGVLAMMGVEGYPYAVPINHFYDEEANKIYFHGARAGHKVEALKANDRVCFTCYGDEVTKKEEWAPFLKSAVVFGRCHLIEDREVTLEMVRRIARKYFPDEATIEEEISSYGNGVQLYEIEIDHISGKEIQER